MVNSAKAFVVPDGGGTVVRGPAGGPATIKARTETTNGSLTLLEVTIGPKEGPPAHIHRREDEAWYLLDGRFRFIADNELLEAAPGSFVFVPRGTAHCFQNLEDRLSRILLLFTPSGMERFFEEHTNLPSGPAGPICRDRQPIMDGNRRSTRRPGEHLLHQAAQTSWSRDTGVKHND